MDEKVTQAEQTNSQQLTAYLMLKQKIISTEYVGCCSICKAKFDQSIHVYIFFLLQQDDTRVSVIQG
jgi:hypothetical protein